MKLLQLGLINFKRFENKQIEFAPHLNLIWGLNESGKSTVYSAITNAFFGRERGKQVENWNGGPCSIFIVYECHDGRFRLERMFTEGSSKLYKITDNDPSDVLTTKDAISSKILEHLGIGSRTVLDNTIFVKQADMSRPGASEMTAVGDEIQRILTGTAHTNATEAIRRLESARNEIKGSARPSNPREYDRISQRISSLAEEIADAKACHQRISQLDEELKELDKRIEQDSARSELLEKLINRHKRWVELKRQETELDRLHRETYIKVKEIDETSQELNSVEKELQKYTQLIGKDDEISNQLAVIRSKIDELELKIAEAEGSTELERTTVSRLAFDLMMSITVLISLLSIIAGFTISARYFFGLIIPSIIIISYIGMRSAKQKSIELHLGKTKASVQDELRKIRNEEKTILNYLGAKNIDEAFDKIQRYRQLAAKANDLDIKYKTLLSGKSAEEWKAYEIDLSRQLLAVKREIEADYLDYNPSEEETAKWQSEYSNLQRSLPANIKRKHEILGAIEAGKQNIKDIAALNGEMEYLQRRRAELDFIYKAYEEAISALKKVTSDLSAKYLPILSEKASNAMQSITNGKYRTVAISSNWSISVHNGNQKEISPDALSLGTIDQLYFSLRVACGQLLTQDHNLPLILDDPFANFDQNRLMQALWMITEISQTNQVILMTHDPLILEWARSNREICNIVML